MLNGKYDFIFPQETSQIPMFELLGTPPEDKRKVVFESSHWVSGEDFAREARAFLKKYVSDK